MDHDLCWEQKRWDEALGSGGFFSGGGSEAFLQFALHDSIICMLGWQEQ